MDIDRQTTRLGRCCAVMADMGALGLAAALDEVEPWEPFQVITSERLCSDCGGDGRLVLRAGRDYDEGDEYYHCVNCNGTGVVPVVEGE